MTEPGPLRAGFAIAVFWLVAQPAAAEPAYIGKWAFDRAGCAAGDYMAAITAREFGGPDSECRIVSVTGGKGVWRAKLTCTGEGAKPNDAVTMRATRKTLTLRFKGGGDSVKLVRCE